MMGTNPLRTAARKSIRALSKSPGGSSGIQGNMGPPGTQGADG